MSHCGFTLPPGSRDSARGDGHWQRGATRAASHRLDRAQRRQAAHDAAEDNMLAVEVRLRPEEQEELRTVGVLARVGHGEHALVDGEQMVSRW